jgi:hypothetical protein
MKVSGFRNRFLNIILVLASLLIFLILAEVIFRRMLFGTGERFEFLRKPEYYAKTYGDLDKIFTDEYWELYYKFGGENKPPKKTHPILGWIFDLDYETLIHPDAFHLNNRRPVLLYGDSFAHCSPESICFEKILNNDPEFAKNYYLLNYGMGGYCVGQISLLLENSKRNYRNPIIIYGFMNKDVERSILSVRIGQKPCFDVVNDSLIIKGLPIEPDPAEFFRKNPYHITSYLYRKFLNSRLNIFHENKKEVNRYIDHIKQVNEKIISNTIRDLRNDKDEFFVMVFNALYNDEGDWRNAFIRDVLEKEGVQYIWSRDLVDRDTTFQEYHLRNYELADGHPTTHFNRLMAEEIKKFVMDTAYREQARELNTQIYLLKKQSEAN